MISKVDAEGWLARLATRDHLARLRFIEDLKAQTFDTLYRVVDLALAEGRPNAQAVAARLVGERGLMELRGALESLAMDPRRAVRVRKASVVALGQLGAPESLAAISAVVDHSNDMVRRAGVEAAGRIGTAGALSILVSGLYDGAWQVRMDAAIGLGGMPESAAQAAFQALDGVWPKEPDGRTGERMLRAMAEVGGVGQGLRGVAVARFIEVLGSSLDWRWRRAAARGLGEVEGGEEARAALLRAAETSGGLVAEEVAWSLRSMEGQTEG